jgi:hypothetical protein
MNPLLMGVIGKAVEKDMDSVKRHCEAQVQPVAGAH